MSEPITLTERERHTADMLAVAIKKWLADSGFVDTARAEGFRAGIGMAAKWHDEWARSLEASSDKERSTKILAEAHRVAATAIRALADKPAPDPLLPGLERALAFYMARHSQFSSRTFEADWYELGEKLRAEIATRKGG